MKKILFVCLFVATTAVADDANTQSVLSSQQTSAPQPTLADAPADAPADAVQVPAVPESSAASVVDNNVVYKGQKNIAPCATKKIVKLTLCEKCVDCCCNCTTNLKEVDVPVCVPTCSCKESTTCGRFGRRVVLDYGKYEVVIHARRDGSIEVDYKKRLLNL